MSSEDGGTEVHAEQGRFSHPPKLCLWAFPNTEVEKAEQKGLLVKDPSYTYSPGVFLKADPIGDVVVFLGCFLDPHFQPNLQHIVLTHTPPHTPQRASVHKPASPGLGRQRNVSNEQLLLTVIALELTGCLCSWWLLQPDISPAALETSLLCLTTLPMPESFRGHSSLGITLK